VASSADKFGLSGNKLMVLPVKGVKRVSGAQPRCNTRMD